MKNALFAALLLAGGTIPALGQTAAPRTLTMSGQGEERATPDTATLSAGVASEAATAAAALAANTARMQGVFAALKKLGIADKDMQTANFSVSPQMASNNTQPPHVIGYQVSNQVQIRLDDVGKLGAALDALVSAGANQMNGVEFSIRDSALLMTQARTDAVADAKTKADTYAKAAGVTLGPILSISESDNMGPRPVFMAVRAMAGKAVPVAAGETSVTANVAMVWEIH
jgi:uncharacterized protein YggE